MNWGEFFKHAVGGGLTIALGESLIERYLSNHNIQGQKRHNYKCTLVGAVGGGVLGYYVGEKVINRDRNYTLPEKLVSTTAGALSGGLVGIVLGHYLRKKAEDEGNPKN